VTFRVAPPVPPEFKTTLAGLRVTTGPEGEIDLERLTVPAKPFRLLKVMAEVPEDPAGMVIEVGFADTVKSWAPMIR
jgi:hypothetical protein